MSDTDLCARCGGDCPMTSCPKCGGCENTGTQPCPAGHLAAGDGDSEIPPCDICAHEREECGACDGTGQDGYDPWGCPSCGGTGEVVPEHCCACGGSPYCACCRTCGAPCIAECRCPVTVEFHDGSTLTLGPAAGDDRPGGA